MTENAKEIVNAAFRIHTTLGPGLLESVYPTVLAYELSRRGLRAFNQQAVPVVCARRWRRAHTVRHNAQPLRKRRKDHWPGSPREPFAISGASKASGRITSPRMPVSEPAFSSIATHALPSAGYRVCSSCRPNSAEKPNRE